MNMQRMLRTAAITLLTLTVMSGVANAEPRPRRDAVLDHRYNHDHYYPPRGYAVRELPRGYYSTPYRGTSYYFHGGVWYRPSGPRFTVVAPPIGIGIGVLPPFYSTVWFGGVPYYYADDTYYVWRAEQHAYVVTEPPGDESAAITSPAVNADLFIYPKNGQSEQQQATDRYECHRWAKQQTGFDPTEPLGGVSESQSATRRADYQRAEGACLEGRGYTVK